LRTILPSSKVSIIDGRIANAEIFEEGIPAKLNIFAASCMLNYP